MQFSKFLRRSAFAALLFSSFSVAAMAQTSAAQTPAKPKSSTATSTAKPAAKPATSYDRALLSPSTLKDKAPDTFQVKFDTTRGEFTITVTRAWSPNGADRFYNLIKHHYYDNAPIFRVVPNFVAQFGIHAVPSVSAVWEKATIKDDPHGQSNKLGTLVFATAGPNTRTTQVFINLKDNSFLDSQGFTPFAAVDTGGMKVVNMFYDQYGDAAGMDQENLTKKGKKYVDEKWPKLDTIKSATLIGAAATAPAKPAAKPAASGTSKPAASTTAKPAAKPQ